MGSPTSMVSTILLQIPRRVILCLTRSSSFRTLRVVDSQIVWGGLCHRCHPASVLLLLLRRSRMSQVWRVWRLVGWRGLEAVELVWQVIVLSTWWMHVADLAAIRMRQCSWLISSAVLLFPQIPLWIDDRSPRGREISWCLWYLLVLLDGRPLQELSLVGICCCAW